MLGIISTLTFFLFGSLFPVFLWVTATGKMDPGFHRFILGLASLVGGMGVVFFGLMDAGFVVKMSAAVWLVSLLSVAWFYWNRERIQAWVVTIPSLIGVVLVMETITALTGSDFLFKGVSILGGLILSGSVFSMLLGHWYLNVVDLPIRLLKRSVFLLLTLLTARLLWDISHLLIGTVDAGGVLLTILEFIETFNGFFLGIALLFGTALPIVLCLLTLRVVKIHSTQSATGLLYVVVISILMGDLIYKYYALQFGIFL
ncbi:MAG: hypothetical protein V3U24_11100 [Candidatus Neomarinimicrobiota bacterium]